MKRISMVTLFVALLVVALPVFASGGGGGGGCWYCNDVEHHTSVRMCRESFGSPTWDEVECDLCNEGGMSCYFYRYQTYDWTCSTCVQVADGSAWPAGSTCVMYAHANADPHYVGPCSSCTTYGSCTGGNPTGSLGHTDEEKRLAQMEPGESVASIVKGLLTLMTPDDYAALEDRISAATDGLPQPNRGILAGQMYVTEMRDQAEAHNAPMRAARLAAGLGSLRKSLDAMRAFPTRGPQ